MEKHAELGLALDSHGTCQKARYSRKLKTSAAPGEQDFLLEKCVLYVGLVDLIPSAPEQAKSYTVM